MFYNSDNSYMLLLRPILNPYKLNFMKHKYLLLFVLLLWGGITYAQKPRLLVTTDIGGDPDDMQALVMLLVHANEFDIEGLVASASGTPGELAKEIVRPDLLLEAINLYAAVENNLRLHDNSFPNSNSLKSVVKAGNKSRGWSSVGAGKDTEGSDWIISVVDKSDARPVNISIWGGQTDLAQALYKVKSTRSASQYNTFVSKVRVHDIADQDGIFNKIIAAHPSLFYILNRNLSDNWKSSFRGMYYQGELETVGYYWVDENIKRNHGALGGWYPMETYTRRNFPYNCTKAGDTPSWYYFLENGMHDPENPNYGGWGGRFNWNGSYYNDAKDTYEGSTNALAAVYRWRREYSHSFAARMDWCVKSFSNANHFPIVKVNDSTAKSVLVVQGAANGTIALNANGTTDPDGDNLSYSWFYYKEAGNYSGGITIDNSSAKEAGVTLPSNFKAGDEVHVILKVKDNGSPYLTSYRRVIIKGSTTAPVNTPPTVNITSPANGSKYTKGANISVAVNASDADGSVVKVEFFNSSTLLGTDNSSPYSFTISNAQASSYTLSAKATDDEGATTTSSVVSITANDAPPPPPGDVVTSISSTGNGSYVKASSLSTGDRYYTDRSYSISSLPSYLSGAEYIKTANNDKASSNANFLSFTLSQSAEVYVIYDSRATSLPSWLTSYTKKSEIVATNDVPMNVYVKTLSGGSYTLGGNLSGGASGAMSNYFVVAKGIVSSSNTTNIRASALVASDPIIAYPVPCNDQLFVKNHVSGSAFKIVNINGLVLMNSVILGNEIDVSKLHPGIYNLNSRP